MIPQVAHSDSEFVRETEETFQSMAKTLGVALGVPRARLDEAITGGKVIETALAG